jgi:hypothetical protein
MLQETELQIEQNNLFCQEEERKEQQRKVKQLLSIGREYQKET